MTGLNATQLAAKLNLSKGRISQLVSDGTFDNCYEGVGRARRFDVKKCIAAYKGLDPGQRLGNGAKTEQAIARQGLDANDDLLPKGGGAQSLKSEDDSGYQMARTQKAIEEARRLRRQNAEAEGTYVLASEAALQVKKLLGQEIAEFEGVLRDGARQIADELGVDFKQVRALLLAKWRDHRSRRSQKLSESAATAELSEAEREADI
ncbi:hypothetical protein SL1157_1659 [Ruegeria lacuscaerulensis ITI-1157]|nr:hypothetical protein SL1157_1659 [Ruegeria lacuscaerulensis ITI-1157]SHK05424.1 hypothetical protein SAMN05444404_3195 [Ruegeria lacuscaerulensis ITI-1157]